MRRPLLLQIHSRVGEGTLECGRSLPLGGKFVDGGDELGEAVLGNGSGIDFIPRQPPLASEGAHIVAPQCARAIVEEGERGKRRQGHTGRGAHHDEVHGWRRLARHADAVIGKGASLQTHLFEDRVMKMSTVSIESGASVGARSVVLYDAVLGHNSTLGPLSLVMKGETLMPDTRWAGIPAEFAQD